MLDDPEKQVWIDTDTRVLTGNTRLAQAQCREIAEKNELRGEGRCTYKGVAKSKNGRSHICIFEREIDGIGTPTAMRNRTMNMNGTGSELTELELKALVGETAWEQMINEDDSKTPTILVGRDQQHENIFIAFQSRSEVEYLLSQLTSLLVHQQVEDAEYTVSVRGRSMTAGDYYALTPQFCDGYSEQD